MKELFVYKICFGNITNILYSSKSLGKVIFGIDAYMSLWDTLNYIYQRLNRKGA